jgi:hypothetical protein
MTHTCAPSHTHRSRSYEVRAAKPPARPSHAEIERLAYSYWEARGKQGGSAVEDWLRAERELMRRAEARETPIAR